MAHRDRAAEVVVTHEMVMARANVTEPCGAAGDCRSNRLIMVGDCFEWADGALLDYTATIYFSNSLRRLTKPGFLSPELWDARRQEA